MMKTILIFVVVALVMAGAAYLVVSIFLAPPATTDPDAESTEAVTDQDDHKEGASQGEILMVEELLVNPTGTSGTRYLSTSLGLEVADAEAVARLEAKKWQIRDLLNVILSSRTVEELTTASDRENMRQEIIERLNQLVAPDEVYGVYFVDYVLQ